MMVTAVALVVVLAEVFVVAGILIIVASDVSPARQHLNPQRADHVLLTNHICADCVTNEESER